MSAPYYVMAIGRRGFKKPHDTLESARTEAHRVYLAMECKCAVVVVETLEIAPAVTTVELPRKGR